MERMEQDPLKDESRDSGPDRPPFGTALESVFRPVAEQAKQNLAVIIPLGAALLVAVAAWVKNAVDAILAQRVAEVLEVPTSFVSTSSTGGIFYIVLTAMFLAFTAWFCLVPMRHTAASWVLSGLATLGFAAMSSGFLLWAYFSTDPERHSRSAIVYSLGLALLLLYGVLAVLSVTMRFVLEPSKPPGLETRDEKPRKSRFSWILRLPGADRLRRGLRAVQRRLRSEWSRAADSTSAWATYLAALVLIFGASFVAAFILLLLSVQLVDSALGARPITALPASQSAEVEVVLMDGDRAIVRPLIRDGEGWLIACEPARIVESIGLKVRQVRIDLDDIRESDC